MLIRWSRNSAALPAHRSGGSRLTDVQHRRQTVPAMLEWPAHESFVVLFKPATDGKCDKDLCILFRFLDRRDVRQAARRALEGTFPLRVPLAGLTAGGAAIRAALPRVRAASATAVLGPRRRLPRSIPGGNAGSGSRGGRRPPAFSRRWQLPPRPVVGRPVTAAPVLVAAAALRPPRRPPPPTDGGVALGLGPPGRSGAMRRAFIGAGGRGRPPRAAAPAVITAGGDGKGGAAGMASHRPRRPLQCVPRG